MPVPTEPARLTTTREFLIRCSLGRLDEAAQLLAPGATYWVPGRHALAGEFRGAHEIVEHLARMLAMTGNTLDVLKWDDWMVGESHVSVLRYVQAQAHGSIYQGRQLYLVTCGIDDLITEIRVFFEDQARAERFFGPP